MRNVTNATEGVRGGQNYQNMDEMMYKCDHSGQRSTAIGLAAGLGGGALLLAIAGIWGINKASEARAAGATQGLAGLTAAMGALNSQIAANRCAHEQALRDERTSREGWQGLNTPTMVQYTNATSQSGAGAGASANALATAEALALLNNQGGINSAIGGCNFLRVARYSAPQPCGCDTCSCSS